MIGMQMRVKIKRVWFVTVSSLFGLVGCLDLTQQYSGFLCINDDQIPKLTKHFEDDVRVSRVYVHVKRHTDRPHTGLDLSVNLISGLKLTASSHIDADENRSLSVLYLALEDYNAEATLDEVIGGLQLLQTAVRKVGGDMIYFHDRDRPVSSAYVYCTKYRQN